MVRKIGRGQMTIVDMNDVVASATKPVDPTEGAMWFNLNDSKLYVYVNKQWKISADYELYVQSRGENLVTNGTGLLGNNTNFSSFTFDGSESFAGGGAFLTDRQNGTLFNDEFIPVDTSRKYRISTMAKSKLAIGKTYFGIAPFDIDKLSMNPYQYFGGAFPTVELTKDLKVGDTVIHVSNASSFNDSQTTPNHLHSLILYGYKNSFGYEYPAGTYSRFVFDIGWNKGAVDRVNNTITLNKPFNIKNPNDPSGVFKVGHKLSATQSGSSYKYTAMSNVTIPKEWTYYEGYIEGVEASTDSNKFAHGMAYMKLMFLTNRSKNGGEAGDSSWFNSIAVTDATDVKRLDDKIVNITETLGNMANDNLLDIEERQVIKDRLTDILGQVIADTATALPTSSNLDSGLKGEFYTVRKSALNAGILSTDALYIDVATKYTALATYLNTMTPIKPWDLRTATEKSVITVVKETFRATWLNYYNAVNALLNATSLKLKTAIDDLEKATGNLLDNPSITGVVGRWNKGDSLPVMESIDFLGKTIPTLKSANTGDKMYIHDDILVDPSKAYEVTMWFKQSAILGSAYVGIYAYNASGTNIATDTVDTLTGAVVNTTNPYAVPATSFSPINTWVKKTFYIMPVGTDPMKMIKVGDGVANNIRMTGDTRRIRIRYLNWSNGTGTKTIWMAQPKMAEVDPNVVTGLSEVDKRVTVAEQKITNDAIVNTVVSSDRWTAQDSKFNQTAEKVAIIVTDTNKINASAIASELSITPTAMNLISQNINLAGKVTISAFDHDLKTDFDTINGWKATGKTTINGANIETGTVTATQIDTSTLIVGKNIAMGEDASISWSKVTSKPTIPTSASQIGAVANNQKAILDTLTNYGVNQGLYAKDGNLYINATYINSGTLSGVKVVSTASNGRTATLEDGGLVVYNGVYNTIVKNAGIEFSTPNYSNTTFLYMNGFSTNENFEFFTDKTLGNTIDFTNAKVKGLTSVAKFG